MATHKENDRCWELADRWVMFVGTTDVISTHVITYNMCGCGGGTVVTSSRDDALAKNKFFGVHLSLRHRGCQINFPYVNMPPGVPRKLYGQFLFDFKYSFGVKEFT